MAKLSKAFNMVFLGEHENHFSPREKLEGKHNFTRHVFIEEDGTLSVAVRLNILNDRHREDIIGFHFAQQYAQFQYNSTEEQPVFSIVSRDSPWDIEYILHDNSRFFLEICRIADKNLLRAIKIENDITSLLLKTELEGFEIRKIDKHFPNFLPHDLVERARKENGKNKKYAWDGYRDPPKLFLRPMMNPRINLKKEIESALRKKLSKPHAGKESTIIILDNLTTHSSPNDFFSAIGEMPGFLASLPFMSIWLYTGYYCDDNGYNCEYSLLPIKLSENEISYLQEHGPKITKANRKSY